MRPEGNKKDEEDISLFYKIILKVPKLNLDSFIDDERLKGSFWAVFLPSFLFCDFFLNILLLVVLNFPFNIVSVVFLNAAFVLLILRILVDRALSSEKAYLNQDFNWSMEKSLKEYLSLIHKNKKDVEGEQK